MSYRARDSLVLSFVLFFLGFFSLHDYSSAETLRFRVSAKSGEPVHRAVAYAIPLTNNPSAQKRPKVTVVDQIDKEFKDYITVVQAGDSVEFPNHDQIRHHVYSFSQVKKFEIPLYSGKPAAPIEFEKPGAVSLGCNIHDWMIGYIFVVDTPYFTMTDEKGLAEIDVPTGEYDIAVWHPQIQESYEEIKKNVKIESGKGASTAAFEIKLKKIWKPVRAPSSSGGGYR